MNSLDSDLRIARSLCAKGKLEVAEGLVEGVLKLNPDSLPFLLLASSICRAHGKLCEAKVFAERATVAHSNAAAGFNELGICHQILGEMSEAVAALERAVSLNPDSAPAHYNLGLALRARYDSQAAFRELAKAVELAPEELENYRELYEQMKWLGNWRDGLKLFSQGVGLHPDSLDLQEVLAHIYGKARLSEDAETLFKQVVERDATRCRLYTDWLRDQGRFSEAVSILRRALSVNPLLGFAYLGLAESKTLELDGRPLKDVLVEILEVERLESENRMYLLYALGAAYDRGKEFAKAFAAFEEANTLGEKIYCAGNPYVREQAAQELALKKELFSAENLQREEPNASSSDRPILIVGMIRSGTTMLDQMLSAHPDISSAGERHYWRTAWSKLRAGIPLDFGRLNPEEYLEELVREAGDAPRITDKMPLNFEHLGLVRLLLPRAKIVHIRRNPLDTCLSIFTTHLGPGPHFAYNLSNIASYYQDYLDTMAYWRGVLPVDQMLELDYEELVTTPEPVMRELLAFLSLPWDPACLHPELNATSVGTPSRWQVRQPIYPSSVGRWKNYPHLSRQLRRFIDSVDHSITSNYRSDSL